MPTIRGMHIKTFVEAMWTGLRPLPRPQHVFLCIADHFEPDWNRASRSRQRDRVQRWNNEYPKLFRQFIDTRGRTPQHTFFYPIEVYDAEHIEHLCKLVRSGDADIEIHLHHSDDSADRLRVSLEMAVHNFHDRHGLLSKDARGKLRYGFVHGNWALDNSDPKGQWCGVNDELTILMQTGCYADFTMPAAPHPAQTRQINSIYYAIDDVCQPKSHDTGTKAELGVQPHAEGLLMVQGPLSVVLQIRIENGNLSGSQPPARNRIPRWLQACVCVQQRPDWVFVKLHTHGAQESIASQLLGPSMCDLHAGLREHAKQQGYAFYYVTARELTQLIHQAERGIAAPDFDQLSWLGDR
jgi:hypothetical protein